MKIFSFLLYFYLLFNFLHLVAESYQIIKGMDTQNKEHPNGINWQFLWHDLTVNIKKENKYSFTTKAVIITKVDSLGDYFERVNSHEKLYVHYEGGELVVPLTKEQFNTLWTNSLFGLIIYRLGLVIITILMILFLRNIKQGCMFSRKSLMLLQTVGVLVLIGGLLDYAGIGILLPMLKKTCGIETYGMIPQNTIFITTPFLAVVGYFILSVAFCFGRAHYLEKENALTI